MAFSRSVGGRKVRMYGLFGAAAVMAAAQMANAAVFTWSGGDPTNPTFWDLASQNWSGGTAAWANNVNRATPNTAVFNLPSPTAVMLQNDNIDTAAITFTTGGWTIGSGGTGVLAYGATGTMAITNTTGTNTINAVIADGSGAGGGTTSISVTGPGTLQIGGINTYSGATTIAAGASVQLLPGGQLGAGSLSNAGSLDLNGQNQSFAGLTGAATGSITNSNAAASTLTVTAGGTFSGAINNGTGAVALVKSGAGTMVLSNTNNSFSGGVTITGGTLQVNTVDPASGNSALGVVPTGTITNNIILNGGTLSYNAPTSTTINSNRGITLGAAGGTLDDSGTGNLNYNGVITDNNGNATLTITGSNTNQGWVILHGANTYHGNTVIANGYLAINAEAALGGSTLVINNAIPVNATLLADTAMTLSAAKTIALGSASGGGGTLSSAGVALTVASQITDNGGSGVLNIGSAGTTAAVVLTNTNNSYSGGTTITSGTLSIDDSRELGAGPLSLTGGALIVTTTSIANLDAKLNAGNAAAFTGSLNVNSGYTSGSPFTMGAALSGTGTFGATGAGYMKLGSAATLPTGTLTVNGGSTLDLNGRNITSKGITSNGATTSVITNTSASTATITIANTGASQVFQGTIGGNLNIIMNGNGSASDTVDRESFANATLSYTGNTTINGGMLLFPATVPSTVSLSLVGGGLRGASPAFAGSVSVNTGANIFQFGSSSSATTPTFSGTVTIAGNSTLQNWTASNSAGGTHFTISGVLAGSSSATLNLTVATDNFATGANVLSGTSPNTFAGAIHVNADTLQLNKTGAGANAAIVGPLFVGDGVGSAGSAGSVVNPDTVQLAASNQIADNVVVTIANDASLPNGLSVGVLDFKGNSDTFAGLSSTGTGASGYVGSSSTSAPSVLTLATSGSNTYSGIISDSVPTAVAAGATPTLTFSGNKPFSLVVTGSGTQILSGNNTYTGTTTVTGGALLIGGAGKLSATTAITISGGKFGIDDTNNTTGAANRFGAATLISGGTFTFIGNASASPTLDSAAALTLVQTSAALPSITASNNGTLTIGALNRTDKASVVFSGPDLGTTANIKFTTDPSVSGIIPFALYDSTLGGSGTLLAAYNGASVMAPVTTGSIGAGGNVLLTASDAGAGSINSLMLNGSGLSIGGGTLTVASGGILNRTGANTINAATLAFGAAEAVFTVKSNLTVNSAITGAGGLTVSGGGSLTLANAGSTYTGVNTITPGSTLVISADGGLGAVPAAVGNNIFINGGTLSTPANLGAVTLNVNRGVAIGPSGATAGAGTINVGAGTTLTINGVVANNGTATQQLIVTGGGKLILGANSLDTYSGGTLVTGGTTLAITGANGAGFHNGVITLDNGTFTNNGANISNNTNRSYQIGPGGGTIDALNGNTITIGTTISDFGAGGGGLVITQSNGTGGASSVSLSANTSFTGGLTINSKTGAGNTVRTTTVNLTGGTQSFTGGLNLNGGGLLAINSAALVINANNEPFSFGGGTLQFLTTARTAGFSFPSTTLTPGASVVTNSVTWTAPLSFGTLTRQAGSTLNFGALPATTFQIKAANSATSILGGYAVASAGGTQFTWASSAGTSSTAGNITAGPSTGYFSYATGDFSATGGQDIDLTSTTNNTNYPSSGSTVNSLRISGVQPAANALTLTLSNPLSVISGGILVSSTGASPAITITGSTITSGNSQDLIVLDGSTSANTVTIASKITGSVGLTFSSLSNINNTLSITSSLNDFTGDTNVTSGTLYIGDNNAIQASTLNLLLRASTNYTAIPAVTFAAGAANPVFGGLKGDGNLSLSANRTLTVGGNNQSTTFSGIVSGTGSSGLIKNGTGALNLTNAETYAGNTSVLNGTLKLNGSLAATSNVTVGNTTTTGLNPTLGGGSGAATGGTLNTNGSHTYNSSATVGNAPGLVTVLGPGSGSAGHLAPGNSVGTLTVGSLTLSYGSILDYEFNASANDLTYVSTSGGLTLNGGGFNLYQEGTTNQFATDGTYDLIRYTGAISGSISNLSVLNQNAAHTYTFGTATIGSDSYVTLTIGDAPTTTSTTFALAASAASLNVLKNGKTAVTSTITNTGVGTADTLNFTGLGLSGGAHGSISGGATGGGPLANNSVGTSSNSGQTFLGTSYGNSILTPGASGTNATLNTSADTGGVTGITINVGQATADRTNSRTSFGIALTASVSATGAYDGLSSIVTGDTGIAGGGAAALGSEATILKGAASADTTVSMAWRTRNSDEVFPSNHVPPFSGPDSGLMSDVVNIAGTGADLIAIQMTYDPTQSFATTIPMLGYYSGNSWVNAGDGAMTQVLGAFDPLNDFVLGEWGVNTGNNTVWAVVNHGGAFAAVPEPASLMLLGLGAVGLMTRRRKK